MKVYVLTVWDYEKGYNVGVFSSIERLEQYKKDHPVSEYEEYDPHEEYILDYNKNVYRVLVNDVGIMEAFKTEIPICSEYVGKIIFWDAGKDPCTYVVSDNVRDAIDKGSELLSMIIYEPGVE